MRNLILISIALIDLNGFTQSKRSPGTSQNDAFRSVKDGYTIELGWALKQGDTIRLGTGSRDRQSFNYLFQSNKFYSNA